MERILVVDAANVVGARADGWWRDRVGATRRLVTEVASAGFEEAVVVVVEGAARGVAEDVDVGVRVVAATGSGDDAIVAEVTALAAGEAVTVVTADRGLRARVEALGAVTVGPRWLLDRL